MSSRRLKQAAIALLLAGAMAMAAPQFAYSAVQADRGANAGITTDPNGYLGIVDNSANLGTVQSSGDVYYLDDNVGAFALEDVSVQLLSYANCVEGATDPKNECPAVSADLSGTTHDFAVTVSCSGTDIQADDTVTVQISAQSSVSVVATRTTTATVATNCRGSGGGGGFSSVTAGNVTTGSATQTLSFSPAGSDVKNGVVTIRLDDATGVNYSGATATVTSGNGQNGHGTATFTDANTIEFTPANSVKTSDTVTIEVTGYSASSSGAGPYTAYFTRSDTGATDTDDFSVS